MPTSATAFPTPKVRTSPTTPFPTTPPPTTRATTTEPDRPPLDDSATAAELLAEAEALFTEAEAGLRVDGDLGAYQERVDEARALIARALELIEEG